MPRKVTQNDLNASFPWCEGCSGEPLNEGGAFCCPASVPFAAVVPADQYRHLGCSGAQSALSPRSSLRCGRDLRSQHRDHLGCELSVFLGAHPRAEPLLSLPVRDPGALQRPKLTVHQGRGFLLVLAAFV